MTGVIQGRAQDSTDLEALEALGDGTSRPVAVHGGLDTQATIGLVGAGASPRAREWGAVASGTAVMIAQSSTNVIVRNARRARLTRFPYSVLYREYEQALLVLAVFHGRRGKGLSHLA